MRDARRADRMGLHRRRRADRDDLQAEIGRGLLHVGRGDVLDDERAAVELLAAGVERLFGRLERRVLELVAQRRQRDVGVVIDEEDGAGIGRRRLWRRTSPLTFSTGASSTFTSVTRTACTLYSSGNVQPVSSYGVRCGSFGLQVLIVQQRIGDAAVRLIHADDVGAGGEGARRRRRASSVLPLLPILPVLPRPAAALGPPAHPARPAPSFVVVGRGGAFLPGTVTVNGAVAREISTPCFCSVRSSSACAPGRGSSAGEHVRRRSFGLRLQDRALALQIEVAQEQLLVARRSSAAT